MNHMYKEDIMIGSKPLNPTRDMLTKQNKLLHTLLTHRVPDDSVSKLLAVCVIIYYEAAKHSKKYLNVYVFV